MEDSEFMHTEVTLTVAAESEEESETIWLEDASLSIENKLEPVTGEEKSPMISELSKPVTFTFDIPLEGTWTVTDQDTGTEREVPAHEAIQTLFGFPFLGIDWDDNESSKESDPDPDGDHPVGSIDGFVEDLTRITQKHGIFIRPKYNYGDIPEVGLYRQNAPHERPSDHPDIDPIPGHLSYSTLGEFYANCDWGGGHDWDGGDDDD